MDEWRRVVTTWVNNDPLGGAELMYRAVALAAPVSWVGLPRQSGDCVQERPLLRRAAR
jgi:hypothetical protein